MIPVNRSIAQYPGSGPFKRDFAVNNNSVSSIDVVVDVVGYIVHNDATALECTTVLGIATSVTAFTSLFIAAPSCPTGYTAMNAQPTTGIYGFYLGSLFEGGCRLNNTTGGPLTGYCDAYCCRVPGL